MDATLKSIDIISNDIRKIEKILHEAKVDSMCIKSELEMIKDSIKEIEGVMLLKDAITYTKTDQINQGWFSY